jgi:energy-coupling factor transporter transmembrane protein EcfT
MANVSPLARGVSTLLIIVGAIICVSPWILGVAWFILLVVAAQNSLLKAHLRVVAVFILPLGLTGLLIQTLLQPIQPDGSWLARLTAAVPLTASITFRVAVIAAAAQICLLPILFDGRMITFLRAWRLSDNAVLVTMGGVTLLAEVKLRVKQILEARLARGFGAATRWGATRELPFILLPLVVCVLDAAGKRSKFWLRRNLIERFAQFIPGTKQLDSQLASGLWLLGSGTWCAVAIWLIIR